MSIKDRIEALRQRASRVSARRHTAEEVTPLEPTTHVVEHTTLEAERFQEMRRMARPLNSMIDNIWDEHGGAEDLVQDLYLDLWNPDPHLNPLERMAATRKLNHAIVSAIHDDPDVKALREHTALNDYAAALAAVSCEERALQVIREHKEKLEGTEKEKEEAEEEVEKAEDEVEKWVCTGGGVPGPGGEPGGPGGEPVAFGPPGPDGSEPVPAYIDPNGQIITQEQYTEELEKAIEAAEFAQQQAQQAAQRAEQAQREADLAAQQALKEAAQEATEELNEEERVAYGWGIGSTDLREMNYQERIELMQVLKGPELRKYTQLFGRFRMMARAQVRRKTQWGRDEVIGVTTGDSLDDVLAAELAMASADPLLELEFVRKFAEKELLVYDRRGVEKVAKGGMVICLDSSGSMLGDREAWAKGLTLALMDEGKRQGRDVSILHFAGYVTRTDDFPGGRYTVNELIDVAKYFAKGSSTEFAPPLEAAVDKIRGEGTRKVKRSDIVFITDGHGHITDQLKARLQQARDTHGLHVYGLCVGDASGMSALETFCDDTRFVHDLLNIEQVEDIFTSL